MTEGKNFRKVEIEINENVYQELEDVVTYFKMKQKLSLHKKVNNINIEILIVGAIVEFLKGFLNQQGISYDTDYEKLKELVNLQNFTMNGTLKNRFKEHMKKIKMPQRELCNITGINKSSISQYLGNKNQMTLDTFLKIWVAIGCPPIEEVLYRD